MNERISALLVRLGQDPALRARFEHEAEAVMVEAGLDAEERAELLRQMRGGTARGRIFAASATEGSSSQLEGTEQSEGRIHAPEGRIFSPEGRIFAAEEGRIHAPEGRIFAAESATDSPDDVPTDESGSATGETPEDVSGRVYGDSADDSPHPPADESPDA